MARSKRQRKQKDLHSLKRKQHHSFVDSNVLVLDTPRQSVTDAAQKSDAEPQHLSKAQRHKLKQVHEVHRRRLELGKAYEALSAAALPEGQLSLYRPIAQKGQRETKRQRLRRELAAERAGVALPSDSRLHAASPLAADSSCSEAATSDDDMPDAQQTADSASTGPPVDAESLEEDSAEVPRRLQAAFAPSVLDLRAVAEAARKLLPQNDSAAASAELAAAAQETHEPPPSINVAVSRTPEMWEARQGLPIIAMEQEVVELINENDVVVLCGETGCGKTTQVPQFLYEAGYGSRGGRIGVTQPRRVAAAASAKRVAQELNTGLGSTVGFQVRYEARSGKDTAIKFMTDGILLREVQSDFLLASYSCIIIDEAHERSLNTDLLLGLLSRIVKLRRSLSARPSASQDPVRAEQKPVQPLKLIIMSATLRIDDFTLNRRLFERPPPVLHVPARQFPVTVHFNRRTELHDYLAAAHRKVCQIHRQLPAGGILVFVTGQREVQTLVKRLRSTLGPSSSATASASASRQVQQTPTAQQQRAASQHGAAGRQEEPTEAEEDAEAEPVAASGLDAAEASHELNIHEDDGENGALEGPDDFELGEADEEEEEVQVFGGEGFTPQELAAAETEAIAKLRQSGTEAAEGNTPEAAPVYVLPLYAMLPPGAQSRVFADPPQGTRLIVVATNVAETSLTIPGIRYVVDAGRSKQKLLESSAGIARYDVRWISQASAAQRAGRAGRTAPGHCYRLYSSAFFNDTFPPHTPPEIANSPLEGVVLAMKALGIDKVLNFPFPSPPGEQAMSHAQQTLVALQALRGDDASLTQLGQAMAVLPLSPRHACMLLQVLQSRAKAAAQAASPAVALAAAMSVESPFIHIDNVSVSSQADLGEGEKDGQRQRARAAHGSLRDPSGDALSCAAALQAYEASGGSAAFCRANHLHERHLQEAAALHKQLRAVLHRQGLVHQSQGRSQTQPWGSLSSQVRQLLCKALTAGWIDQVARRIRTTAEPTQRGAAGSFGKASGRRAVRYETAMSEGESVFLHPLSSLHRSAPEYLVYSQIIRTDKRPYMTGVTEVDARWLSDPPNPLCVLSAPLDSPAPSYLPQRDAVVTWHAASFGPHSWQLPPVTQAAEDHSLSTAVFARALLEGKVLPAFKGLQQHLAASPTLLTSPEAQAHRRVADLLAAMQAAGIHSRALLAGLWQRQPEGLLQELSAWLKKGSRGLLLQAWPQLRTEALSVQAKRRARV